MKPATIADEASFHRMLSLERKRSERTGAAFALVLLDGDKAVLQKLGPPLWSIFRETDITGWYQLNSTIGLIFTSLNGTSRQTIKSAISTRVAQVLAQQLTAAQIQKLDLSFHFFPEDEGGAGSAETDSRNVLYPEFRNKPLYEKLFAALKRATDIAGSLFAIVILTPVFLAIGVGIKLTSTGPILFRQKRLGKAGVEFTFLKFRSMYQSNDPQIHRDYTLKLIQGKVNGPDLVYKIQNDPRVTPFGRFLRVSSLDELPQFFNVLTGKMSLVGPRPPIRYEFDHYQLWHRRRVLEAKPGMTGVWQVNGRSRTTFDEMVRMDLQYVRDRSFWYDLKILVKTPWTVIRREGAY